MKSRILLLFLFIVSVKVNAQVLRRPLAAGYTGFGAYSINHTDAFSFTANQAALAQATSVTAGIYGEKRFLLSELNNYTAIAALPTSSGNFGIRANYAGFTDYNETQLGLAYGRKLGTKVDIGAQFNYNAMRITSYGQASAISFEFGAIFHVTDKIHAGVHASNPMGGKYGKNNQEKLASVYSIGFGYDASEKFLVSTEIQKEEDQPINVNAGFQYKIVKQLLVRAGVSSATSTFWAGAGISLKSLRLDVIAGFHPQLGVTPGVMLLFEGKSKNKTN
jgi:hypothetical protein